MRDMNSLFSYLQPWLNGLLIISTSAFIDIPAIILGIIFGSKLEIYWTEDCPIRSVTVVEFWRRYQNIYNLITHYSYDEILRINNVKVVCFSWLLPQEMVICEGLRNIVFDFHFHDKWIVSCVSTELHFVWYAVYLFGAGTGVIIWALIVMIMTNINKQ
jgi:hypothetical protein